MRPNRVKRRLADGGAAFGTFLFEFNTTGVARVAAGAGAEFAVFDMEHTGWTLETVRMLVATARATDMVPVVRVPANEPHFVSRVLDTGAVGVMVPMVETGEQARRFVRSAKYPPSGRRGAAFGLAHDDYTDGDLVTKMREADGEQLLIALVETEEGVANVEAIAAVDGLDVLWVGHYDLTCSLGIPGEFTHPTFLEALGRVLRACRTHGKAPGILVSAPDEGRARLDQGFRMLAYGGDLWLYQRALREGLSALRGVGGPP